MKCLRKSLSILLIISIFMSIMITTAVQSSALNSDDYRAWSHHDSRWSSTTMGNSTVGNGGAPTTAVTKLAIQAGLRDSHDFDIGSMATLLTANSGYSGSAIVWSAVTKPSLNLFSSYKIFDGGTSSSANSTLLGYLNSGWHLVIQVTTSSGTSNYVAVDEKVSLDKGSIYIMDCYSNTANNVNVKLSKRYSSFSRVIGYKGKAAQSSSIDSDYRVWELNNSNWADTALGSSGKTMLTSKVGGGDLVLASTKLAIQARLIEETNAVSSAITSIGTFGAGGTVALSSIKTAFGFQEYNSSDSNTPLMGSGSDTASMSTTLSDNTNSIKTYLAQGYYLAIRINNSVGWVAVDTEKTLATGDIYIMRSTPDASKNADIKLSDYYDTVNCVVGFRVEGVKVNLNGNATFTAKYTPSGSSAEYSLASGGYVPNGAAVSITATPKAGYTAADNWTISGGYSGAHTASTFNFTANTSTNTVADITYTPTANSYDIDYVYGTNSTSFVFTTTPRAATTGSEVAMEVEPKTDGSFVYELKVVVKDDENNEIPVEHNGTNYVFTMPASDVTVTFTGENVDDWRKWARDDERWRDTDMTETTEVVDSVKDNGAVMIGLTKLSIQAGVKTPTTLAEDHWDINETVHALQSNIVQSGDSVGQLIFNNNTAAHIGFDSFEGFLGTDTTSSTHGDITTTYPATIVTNLKNGYHQLLRISSNSSSLDNPNSEWVAIDEEKTLEAVGKKERAGAAITASDIYVFRATVDTNKNANHNLQEFYTETTYRYVWRNYAYLGGTTPARKLNYTIYSTTYNENPASDAHKGAVAAEYTIEGESTEFVSGDYVPSRATISLKYNAEQGYYSFTNWTTSDTAVTSLSATETANPKEFTVNPSEFRATNNSTTASIRCNITPEEYHIYYTDGSGFSYSNNPDNGSYNTDVSFKIIPDNGYTVNAASVEFKDADDNTIAGVSATKDGKTYTFTMPAKDVYISATAATQTYDDYRMWGVNDSRWSSTTIRPGASVALGTHASDGDIVVAMTKLFIQAGFDMPSGVTGNYNANDSENNETFMRSFITKATSGTSSYVIQSNGSINSWGWGYMPYNLGIIGSPSNASQGNYYAGATAGGTRNQAFVYPQLLNSGTGPYTVTTLTPLIIDYLAGTYTVTSGLPSSYDSPYNAHSYKFHLMLYVNSTYGWVAVDEAQTLNTGEIWVWASHGVVSGNGTSQSNICKLSDLSTTFERAAGFKAANGSNYYGSSKANFTPYESGNDSTASGNATLKATYSYLGQQYPATGNYDSGLYVPHGATVTISRTALSDGFNPATDKAYGAWVSTDSSVTPATYSATAATFDTEAQSAAASRKEYNLRYYIDQILTPKVHLKFLGDEHGTLYGSGTSLSDEAVYYQGDTIVIAPVPDENYEVDKILIKKTDSNFQNVLSTTEEDANIDRYTFTSEITGDAESYFIIQATFATTSTPLEITYNFKEYDPSKSHTYEYIEGATFNEYLTDKTYTAIIDDYDPEAENAITSQVIANAPVLHNVYFNYTLDISSITSDTSSSPHTATVTMTPTVKQYLVSVNGTPIDGTFHFQEEIALDASDYNVDSDDVVWTSSAESGKTGSATVCYDTVYSFRVTSDLNLTVGENLTSRNTVDGTSAVTPGYTEMKRENNVEKCYNNFYIQDFFDNEAPRVYDSSGNVIEDAEDVTFLGAGVMFYAYDTSENKPTKVALDGIEPTREGIYNILDNNKNAFLTEATGQGNNFKGSNINYSYIKASTDNGNKVRYSSTTESYNYFFTVGIRNDRTPENQKFVYRVYSFYVCSYTLNGTTYVTPVLSGNYAQAKMYSINH